MPLGIFSELLEISYDQKENYKICNIQLYYFIAATMTAIFDLKYKIANLRVCNSNILYKKFFIKNVSNFPEYIFLNCKC